MQTNLAPERLNKLMGAYAEAGVSDVHIHPGAGIRISLHNTLYKDNVEPAAGAEEIESWIYAATGLSAEEALAGSGQVSKPLETTTVRLRCTFRRSLDGISASFRIIPRDPPTLASLDLQDAISGLIHRQAGLIMIEGGTGHGKSTLAAGLLRGIGETYDKHLYLIEDPIEFIHPEYGNSSVIQREIGDHVPDYPTAVENALRSRPHVILIGEMLNPATARAALHAATTGHLVITTAHAGSVTEAVEGFIGQFPAGEQPQIRTRLSQSLLAVIVQRLVPDTAGQLVAARELMVNNLNFAAIIRKGDEHLIHGQLQTSRESFTLEQSLSDLVRRGLISEQTARASASNVDALVADLSRIRSVA